MQSTRRHAQITSFRHVEREGITEISHTMEGNFFFVWFLNLKFILAYWVFVFWLICVDWLQKISFLLKFVGFPGFFVGWVVGVFVARCTEWLGGSVDCVCWLNLDSILSKKKETCNLCLAFQCSQMICQNLEYKA